jgi:hypothetical protein
VSSSKIPIYQQLKQMGIIFPTKEEIRREVALCLVASVMTWVILILFSILLIMLASQPHGIGIIHGSGLHICFQSRKEEEQSYLPTYDSLIQKQSLSQRPPFSTFNEIFFFP